MTDQSDGSAREAGGNQKPYGVPGLRSAVGRRLRLERPRRFVEQGKEVFDTDVIEIDIETDADFAIGGTGPALIIGKTVLLESVHLAERHYRFYALGSLPISDEASVALALGGTGTPALETRGRVKLQWDSKAPR
jgi:hypothetical protein